MLSDLDLIKKARELTRSDRTYSFKEHLGRLMLVNHYGVELDDNLKIVLFNELPAKVYPGDMNGDYCVFLQMVSSNQCQPLGWLTMDEIEESEIHWVIENEERVDYYHEIPEKCMIQMPQQLVFEEDCKHTGDFMWSHDTACWECLECNRNVINADYREEIGRQDSLLAECG